MILNLSFGYSIVSEALTLVHDLLILSTSCKLQEVAKDDNKSELPWISNLHGANLQPR